MADWTIRQGDCRELLREMPAESVQCVVCSPPYWGLRDYKTEPLVWCGGLDTDALCDGQPQPEEHEWGPQLAAIKQGGQVDYASSDLRNDGRTRESQLRSLERNAPRGNTPNSSGSFCHCGAWRGSLGLEPTPELYVEHMVEIFREVRRVLRKDGTLWLVIGDSYATGAGKVGERPGGGSQGDNWQGSMTSPNRMPLDGLKPKDLVGIPWRVAFALQADGWWLRSDVIWSKPNPMPESVRDRPTRAHEYVFLLTRSARYYYDAEAIKEGNADPERTNYNPGSRIFGSNDDRNDNDLAERPRGWKPDGRNKRSVWHVATEAYPEAHFATYPVSLIEPCILAGTSEKGCCSECGAPWERVVERKPVPRDLTKHRGQSRWAEGTVTRNDKDLTRSGQEAARWKQQNPDMFRGWQPTCDCNADCVACVVLDPFCGSGATGVTSLKHGRRAILFDLSAEYCELTRKRITEDADAMNLDLFHANG